MPSSTLGHRAYLTRGYISSLDAVRAICVLFVLTFHAKGGGLAFLNGARGVQVFFLLSGYLITTLSLREESRTGRLDLRGFFVRRIFRIMPVYVVVLSAYCVLVLGLGVDNRTAEFKAALPWYVGYLQEIPIVRAGQDGAPFGVAWSLGIEEKFYLLWPLIAFLLLRRRAGRVWVAAGGTVAFLAVGLAAPHGVGPYVVHYASILLGATLAFALHTPAVYERLRVLGRPQVLACLLIAVAVLWMVPMPDLAPFDPAPSMLGFLVPATLALGGLVTADALAPRLAPRALVYVGRISYAFYLTHQLALQVVYRVLPGLHGVPGTLVQVGLALPITIVLSEALHRTVEQPMIRRGRTLAARRATAPTAEPLVPAAPTRA